MWIFITIFMHSYDFFKAWDLAMLLVCQHRKTCNYYLKDTNRKQKSRRFNGLVQVFTESLNLTLNLVLLNHKPTAYSWDYLYNLGNVCLKRKLVRITHFWNLLETGILNKKYLQIPMQWNRESIITSWSLREI